MLCVDVNSSRSLLRQICEGSYRAVREVVDNAIPIDISHQEHCVVTFTERRYVPISDRETLRFVTMKSYTMDERTSFLL